MKDECMWTLGEMVALEEMIEQNRLQEAKGFILAKKLNVGKTLVNVSWIKPEKK